MSPAGRGAASAPISSALRRSTTVRTPWASSARQPGRGQALERVGPDERAAPDDAPVGGPQAAEVADVEAPSQSSCRRTAVARASAARVTGRSGAVARAEPLVAAAVEQQRPPSPVCAYSTRPRNSEWSPPQ